MFGMSLKKAVRAKPKELATEDVEEQCGDLQLYSEDEC
jgi:hypothetical protein